MARVRAVYDRLKINAELAPFFNDLPARLASSHLVVSRSGAGTVAELRRHRPPVDPGAAARFDRPGSVRQCRHPGAGEWRASDSASGFYARPAGRGNRRAGRGNLSGSPPWPPPLAASEGWMPAERLADLVMKGGRNLTSGIDGKKPLSCAAKAGHPVLCAADFVSRASRFTGSSAFAGPMTAQGTNHEDCRARSDLFTSSGSAASA